MPRYYDVVQAARETCTKILALRLGSGGTFTIEVTTQGGKTASVTWDSGHREAKLNLPSIAADAILLAWKRVREGSPDRPAFGLSSAF